MRLPGELSTDFIVLDLNYFSIKLPVYCLDIILFSVFLQVGVLLSGYQILRHLSILTLQQSNVHCNF